jgi:carbon-monoxide dehydrogenase medium subunit
LRARQAEAALIGKPINAASLEAAAQAVRAVCDPAEDLRGDAEYKTAMAGEMTKRAISAAAARCS